MVSLIRYVIERAQRKGRESVRVRDGCFWRDFSTTTSFWHLSSAPSRSFFCSPHLFLVVPRSHVRPLRPQMSREMGCKRRLRVAAGDGGSFSSSPTAPATIAAFLEEEKLFFSLACCCRRPSSSTATVVETFPSRGVCGPGLPRILLLLSDLAFPLELRSTCWQSRRAQEKDRWSRVVGRMDAREKGLSKLFLDGNRRRQGRKKKLATSALPAASRKKN